MHFPSLNSLVDKTTKTFRRFPFAILAAIGGTCLAIARLHVSYESEETHHFYWNAIMCSHLAMLFFIAITAIGERRNIKSGSMFVLHAAGIAAALLYYFSLPDHFMVISMVRFALYSLGLHLFIAFAPYTGKGELNGFWQYNKIILLRMLTSVLYSGVLYVGLALAILAIEQLFKVQMNNRIYADLWLIIAGIFNSWFFLAGFPKNYADLEEKTDYPKGLKIFTQYVLLPIITVYLVILYAYMVKIIFAGQLPDGWVSYLVLGFSIAGILSLLLIHPVRNDDGNKWMLIYSRFFYFALFPLIILLFVAIKRRIDDYGITENRYFVLVLALWLIFIAAYFLFSRNKNIKLIPVSLCIVAFLSSFGPWGAFSVSLRSQEEHFSGLLEKNKMMSGGKAVKASSKMSFGDHKEICSIVEYINEVHGYESLQPFFVQDLDSLMKSDSLLNDRNSYGQVNKILGLINISYVNRYQTGDDEKRYISYNSEPVSLLEISGYEYLISDFNKSYYETENLGCSSYTLDKSIVDVCFDFKSNRLSVSEASGSKLLFDASALIKNLRDSNNTSSNPVKAEALTLTASNDKLSVKAFFKIIYGEYAADTMKLSRIQADILIHLIRENENEVGEKGLRITN